MPQLRTEGRIAGGTSVEHVDTVDWRSAAACLDRYRRRINEGLSHDHHA